MRKDKTLIGTHRLTCECNEKTCKDCKILRKSYRIAMKAHHKQRGGKYGEKILDS